MGKKILYGLFIVAVAIFNAGSTICYGDDTSQAPKTWKIKLGLYERFRIETWDNSTSLSSDALAGTSYTRTKTNLSFQCFYKDKSEFNLKVGNEFRQYFITETKAFNLNEIFIDQFNLKWNSKFKFLSSITVGRQNLSFGEGFIIMDGGPLDGSRSSYFDAARIDFALAPKKLLTCFYTNQNDIDRFLPVINDKKQALNPRPEQMYGVYANNDFGKANLQSYFVRKHTNESFVGADDGDINTIGSRVLCPLGSGFSATAEAAYQFGELSDYNIAAYGGYGYLTWQSQKWLNHPYVLTLGTIYLSGNDPSSDKYEGWDPLYGRWPKWSESYIYTLINESGVAYWTNLLSIYLKTQYEFSPSVKLFVDYYHLTAPQKSTEFFPFPGGNGKTRGELLTSRLTYKLSKEISGHMVWEYFDPGSYYFKNANHADWLRMEFLLNL